MKEFLDYKVAPLFDPVQTHVIHGVHKSEVEFLKGELRQVGATRFRVVKNKAIENTVSLCFKLKNGGSTHA